MARLPCIEWVMRLIKIQIERYLSIYFGRRFCLNFYGTLTGMACRKSASPLYDHPAPKDGTIAYRVHNFLPKIPIIIILKKIEEQSSCSVVDVPTFA
jgi:hypothetical protein